MKLAYLVNQHPLPSQTFIRREIAALEELGIPVERYTIRTPFERAVDPADVAESRITRSVLGAGPARILAAVVATAVVDPRRFATAVALAVRLSRRSHRGVAREAAYFAEACLLARWLRRSGVTHVHVHFGTNSVAVALLAKALGGPTYSFTVHGPEEFDRPEALKLREKVAAAELVVAISEYGRSQLLRWSAPEDWPKIHVVRCGLDRAFLGDEPEPIPAGPRLVSVGRLSEQKGQLVLIEAVARVAEEVPGLELVLIGDGDMREEVERAIDAHGCRDVVRLTGVLDSDAVRKEIDASRAVVLPSFAEGLPVVLMEALARGRPVVTTYIAGIPELVDDGCGWLVPAGSVDDLVVALREVLAAPPRDLEEMGREGRRRVLDRHDVRREAARLAELLGASPASSGTS